MSDLAIMLAINLIDSDLRSYLTLFKITVVFKYYVIIVSANGNLQALRLSAKGEIISHGDVNLSSFGSMSHLNIAASHSFEKVEAIRKAVENKEGCRISGTVKVNKVPGNLHFSTHSYGFMFGGENSS
jgi:hypothetical protein